MRIVNDDGSPVSQEQEALYFRAREREYLKGRAMGLLAGLWSALKAVLPTVLTSALTVVLVMFFLGQLTMPTGGCHWPTPPGPGPPQPTDPLTKALRAAYDADPDPQKAAHLPDLAGVLAGVVPAAKASGTVSTTADLAAAVHRAASLAIGDGGLPEVRKAVGAYLVTKLPTDPARPMTADLWQTAADEYAKVAAALRGVR